MTEETKPNDTILFSNVTLVRNQEGELSLWVGNEKIVGVANINVAQGFLAMSIPLNRLRLAEDVPATSVAVDKSNVIEFKNFRKLQVAVDNTVIDDTPTTDGDSQ